MRRIVGSRVLEHCAETGSCSVEMNAEPAMPLEQLEQRLIRLEFRTATIGGRFLIAKLGKCILHAHADGTLVVNECPSEEAARRLAENIIERE